MAAPLVSIMVPVYGVEAFIERCARSLFEQTFQDIEYVFVNDCTPDQSIPVLKRVMQDYPHRIDRIKIIEHSQNSGIAVVRNTLLENATGIYTMFIDSDDWAEKNMIEVMYNKISAENADILGCDCYFSYPDSEVYYSEKYSTDKMTVLKRIISVDIKTFLHKLMIKRSLYTDHDIRAIPDINVTEDYILYVKLFYFAQHTTFLKEAYYHYVQYNPNCYSNLNMKNIEDRLNSVKVVEDFCKEKGFYEEVKKEIDGRKFIIKTRFLIDETYEDFDRWKKTYPEANYAWRQFNFRIDYRLLYWFAELHFFKGVKLINRLKKMMHRSG